MVRLQKRFELDAGHRLCKHDYKCQNLHGHRYQFKLEVEGEASNSTGMVVDFAHLKEPIMEAFDHNLLLNKEDPILQVQDELEEHQAYGFYLMDGEPTAENIAEEAIGLLQARLAEDERERIDRIRLTLHETPTSSVVKVVEL